MQLLFALKINSLFSASWQCVFHHSNSLWLLAFESKSGIGFVWSFLLKLLSFLEKHKIPSFRFGAMKETTIEVYLGRQI